MRTNQAKMDGNLKEMREELTIRLEAIIEVNNEKLDVLLGSLVSQIDIHQARTEANQREITEMKACLEKKRHGLGGKSPSRRSRKPLRKKPRWKLSEYCMTDMGTGI
jgi:hypothetical protein